jgi:hypothetical protein
MNFCFQATLFNASSKLLLIFGILAFFGILNPIVAASIGFASAS